jgi:beta-mannosidase
LAVLDRESRAIIERLRPHASLAIWCGGNELFNEWSKMTDQDAPLRLLNANTFHLDPDRPFLTTSPLMGMGHGTYIFRGDDGREAHQVYAEATRTAYTEFGVAGPASEEVLRTFMPEEDLFPVRRGTTWVSHHALDTWDQEPEAWLMLPLIEDYFGKCGSVEEVVRGGQTLQAEGTRFVYEEARRQWPRSSMALAWCLNEPWPTAANNSLVSWPCVPKPALTAVALACRPTLASARVPKFRWFPGEIFDPELWLLNDAPEAFPASEVTAELRLNGETLQLLTWSAPEVRAGAVRQGPRAAILLPDAPPGIMELHIRVRGRSDLDSIYPLVFGLLGERS